MGGFIEFRILSTKKNECMYMYTHKHTQKEIKCKPLRDNDRVYLEQNYF